VDEKVEGDGSIAFRAMREPGCEKESDPLCLEPGLLGLRAFALFGGCNPASKARI